MSDIDERLAQLLDDAVPRPPREFDGAEIRNARPRRRIVRMAAPALAAAVVVAVAVIAVVVIRPASDETGVGSGKPTNGTTTNPTKNPPPPAGSSPREQTLAAVKRLLAAAPRVPNTDEVDHPPAKQLRQPMSQSTGNLVDRARWWIGTGTVGAAFHYFANHLPDGLTKSGSGSASGPNGPTVEGLTFDAAGPDWSKPTIYSNLELDVEAVQLGDQVGIRVDAQGLWLVQRTDAENIPDSVSSVDVVVSRPGRASAVTRTLDAKDARQLAKLINALPVAMRGQFSCPMDFGGTDTLTFRAGTITRQVRVDPTGCQGVTLAGSAKNFPGLTGGGKVNISLMKMLGLPKDYGLRR
jgi:hypothetical protein